jgi:hypothetical protein
MVAEPNMRLGLTVVINRYQTTSYDQKIVVFRAD